MQFFKITYHSTVPPQQRDLSVGATKTQYRNLNCKTIEQALYQENVRLEMYQPEWKAVSAELHNTKPRQTGMDGVAGNVIISSIKLDSND